MRLTNSDTGLDLDLICSHERGILNKGLFTTLASAQSLLFPEALSPTTQIAIGAAHPFYERIFDLAHGFNPVLLPPGFCPNFGRGISVLPSFIATYYYCSFCKRTKSKALYGCHRVGFSSRVSPCSRSL
jgi:hypothetical protein